MKMSTDYDKQRKNYEAQTMVFSKALLNGGRNFVKYNVKTKKYATGNTASTAFNSQAPIYIQDVTTKMLRDITRQLNNLGYTEHKVRWVKGVDAYEQIMKAGLN